MGPEEKTAPTFNFTFVRPAKFYLTGFSNIPASHATYFYVFLCFVYIMTVVGNGFLLLVIYIVETLHTPKYMIVFNLALADLCGSTAFIPKLLDTFFFDRRYIVYEACLSYMFFVIFFASLQSWTLVIMAYDRFIAICFPLRYHSFVTKSIITAMLLFAWLFLLILLVCMVGFINRLSFCRSVIIPSPFCDHTPLYRLACNDTSLNYIMGLTAVMTIVCLPLVLIALTYICISIALSRIASGQERLKALKTCSSHLLLVALFFLPTLGSNIAILATSIHPDARFINCILTATIPAFLNPIVYSLKTDEIMDSIVKLYKSNRISNKTKQVNSLSLLNQQFRKCFKRTVVFCSILLLTS